MPFLSITHACPAVLKYALIFFISCLRSKEGLILKNGQLIKFQIKKGLWIKYAENVNRTEVSPASHFSFGKQPVHARNCRK